MDLQAVMRDYVDFLVPRLDTYEQALYIFILRQTHLNGNAEATIGFKSARRKMGFGIGEKGKPMSEHVAYQRLKSLAQKGCVEILDSLRDGTRLRLRLPAEIPGLIPAAIPTVELDLDEMDFFTVPHFQ